MKKLLTIFMILASVSVSLAASYETPSGGVTEGSDVTFGHISAISLHLETSTTTGLSFGDGDSRLAERSDDILSFIISGTSQIDIFSDSMLGALTHNFRLYHSRVLSYVLPHYTWAGDDDTGLSHGGDGQVSLTSNGVEAFRTYTTHSEFYPSGTGQVKVYDDGSLIVDGGVAYTNITTVFSNYSVDISDKYVFINASSDARTLYVPDATLQKGAEIRYKKVDGLFNSITFEGYSTQTINNDATYTVSFPGNAFTMLSDGANWQTTQATGEVLSFSSYHFESGASGIYYTGGGSYHADATDANLTQAATSTTHGDANEPAGSHIFWVFGGATSVPDGTVFLNVSGTHVDEDGVSTTEELTLIPDLQVLTLDDYIETIQKFVGVTTYKLGCTGTCTTYSADGNIGHAKYADFQDRDVTLRAIEVSGTGGAADTGFDLCIKHHNHIGWTYAATFFVPGNGDLACLGTDYGVNDDLSSGGHINWDRKLNTFVEGSDNEGLIVEVTTTQNNSVRDLSIKYGFVYK